MCLSGHKIVFILYGYASLDLPAYLFLFFLVFEHDLIKHVRFDRNQTCDNKLSCISTSFPPFSYSYVATKDTLYTLESPIRGRNAPNFSCYIKILFFHVPHTCSSYF